MSRHGVLRARPTQLLGALVAGLLGALALAAPAAAHGADAPDGTNYRSTVRGVNPQVPGLTVRVIEAGARLELLNHTGRTIEVLGYAGEPYLEIRPDGVYENSRSPATYLNRTLDGETGIPAGADPSQPPSWQRVGTEPLARWHDQRSRWTGSGQPPAVAAAPEQEHRIRDWVVPLRDGTTALELHGSLDWLPPPDPFPWWALSLLGGLAVGALGLLPGASRAGRAGTVALAALAGLGGVAAIGFALGRGADAGTGALLGVLFGGQLWPTLTGLGALAAGAYAISRRPAADFALALAGTGLALFAGVTNAAVFLRSVVPVPWPAGAARLLVALVIAIGAGLTMAGVLRLRATRPVDPAAPEDPVAASPRAGLRTAEGG
ncbi:hypothetical protein [Plantactinospora sp. CA-290183]|uniref:hypothetical protein n=1 Tax=Plantactinospora sp. CA-290183 TaxID=3240006 RepID=UPI003D946DF0